MPWQYRESTGELSRDGVVVATGYSGRDMGKNNPDMDDAVGVGPIPCGNWTLEGVRDSPNTGPFSIALDPDVGTKTFGRSAFRIHGDSIQSPGTASHGCIILNRVMREKMWFSGDLKLTVVV